MKALLFRVPDRQTLFVRHPWHALTRLLTAEHGSPPGAGAATGAQDVFSALVEAWTEAAARLDLVRLAWWEAAEPLGAVGEPTLAFPAARAVMRTFTRPWSSDSLPVKEGGTWMRPSACGGEDEAGILVEGSVLMAASEPGRMPSRAALVELATLALAIRRKQVLLTERERNQARLSQAHATAAAGHDLRNELTRALLFAGRGQESDGPEVLRALAAARDLAQSALLVPDQAGVAHGVDRAAELASLELVDLRKAVSEEVRAAAAAARAPLGCTPSVRLKCPKDLRVLVHERTFRRALRNVALNAMEATVRSSRQPMGAVTVLAERIPEVSDSGYSVRLMVRDEGTGMHASEVASFLDPRGAASHASSQASNEERGGRPASTGLGTASLALALAASAIPLQVKSRVNHGSELTFWLRSIADPRSPVQLLIDPDPRRGRRELERLRERSTEAWVVLGERAAAPLLRSSYVQPAEGLQPAAETPVEVGAIVG